MDCWQLLDIAPTSDRKQIKRAYAKRLKTIDQVAQAEDFQALREAYERALMEARYYQEEQDIFESSEESQTESVQTESVQTEPCQAEPIQTEPTQIEQAPEEIVISDTSTSGSATTDIEQAAVISYQASWQQSGATDDPLDESETTPSQHSSVNPYEAAENIMKQLVALNNDPARCSDISHWQAILSQEDAWNIEVKEILRFEVFAFVSEQFKDLGWDNSKPIRVSQEIIRYLNDQFGWTDDEISLSRAFSWDQISPVLKQIHGYQNFVKQSQATPSEKGKPSVMSMIFGWVLALWVLSAIFKQLIN